MLGEDLVLDPGLAVLADPARLLREHYRRLTLERQDDVRVAVQEPEAGEVAHGPLETRVLRARDHDGVEAVLLRLRADVRVPALDLGLRRHSVLPLTSCVSARLSGAATP